MRAPTSAWISGASPVPIRLPHHDADGATIWSTPIGPQARILEISCPADWQELVARFPRDVTSTHDGGWRYRGGVPGPWRLPDWLQVIYYYNGVHFTITAGQ